jgi:hypothetical protein
MNPLFARPVVRLLAIPFLLFVRGGSASAQTFLKTVADIPLPGGATRFDYQSLDPATGRLYLSHMGGGCL